MEFDDLGKREKEALDNFAEVVFARRAALTAPPEDQEVHELEGRLLEHPWFKHAADIRFAEEAVWRGTGALSRYLELRPILTRLQLSQHSQTYLGEAVQTFLFHFDAACIAFCEATLEQVLKEALVRSGVYTERELRRDQPTGMSLLIKAKGLLTDSYDLAKKLIEERNRIMHRDIGDQQALHDSALESIAALGAALQELGRTLSTH